MPPYVDNSRTRPKGRTERRPERPDRFLLPVFAVDGLLAHPQAQAVNTCCRHGIGA